jgi:hypothetical protein
MGHSGKYERLLSRNENLSLTIHQLFVFIGRVMVQCGIMAQGGRDAIAILDDVMLRLVEFLGTILSRSQPIEGVRENAGEAVD